MMHPLIYLEDSEKNGDDPHESPSNPNYVDNTPEFGTPSKKNTKEPTSELDSYALSETSAPTREVYMGHPTPRIRSTQIYHPRGAHQGGSLGIHPENCILVQYKILEAVEDLLTPTKSPHQIPTNLEEMYKDAVGADLTREDMATEDLLRW